MRTPKRGVILTSEQAFQVLPVAARQMFGFRAAVSLAAGGLAFVNPPVTGESQIASLGLAQTGLVQEPARS
jgi:hypothetical protein